MANTNKQLAELLAKEKKLLELQKKEKVAHKSRHATVKNKLSAVKKEIREEQRKRDERRAALLGRCMMQKFNSDPDAKETMLQELDGFLSKPEDRELFGMLAK